MLYDIDTMPKKQTTKEWIEWKKYFNEICPFCDTSGWHTIRQCQIESFRKEMNIPRRETKCPPQ